MTKLLDLPVEVLLPIIECLYYDAIESDDEPRDKLLSLSRLAAASPYLYPLCNRYLYRNIAIDNQGYSKHFYQTDFNERNCNTEYLDPLHFAPVWLVPQPTMQHITSVAFYFSRSFKVRIFSGDIFTFKDNNSSCSWQDFCDSKFTPNLRCITLGVYGAITRVDVVTADHSRSDWPREMEKLNEILCTRRRNHRKNPMMKLRLVCKESFPSRAFLRATARMPVALESFQVTNIQCALCSGCLMEDAMITPSEMGPFVPQALHENIDVVQTVAMLDAARFFGVLFQNLKSLRFADCSRYAEIPLEIANLLLSNVRSGRVEIVLPAGVVEGIRARDPGLVEKISPPDKYGFCRFMKEARNRLTV